MRMRWAATSRHASDDVDAITSHLPVLPYGEMIGLHDLLIAATALANGHAVATLNRKDFERIPGLRLVEVAPFV